MALSPWEPSEGLTPLREAMSRLLEESFVGMGPSFLRGRTFPVNVRETDNDYFIEASLPGIAPDAVQINATSDTVTIHIPAKPERPEAETGRWVRHERYEGEAMRTIELPSNINPDKVTASCEHGVVTLQLPKAEEAKRKQIPVHVKH